MQMLPLLFRMPDEVIDELSRGDLDYEGWPGGDYVQHAGADYFADRPVSDASCKQCGFKGLVWKSFPQGYRLTYKFGQLKGKIHACKHEL